jgi:low affinity Fe/Cu permease
VRITMKKKKNVKLTLSKKNKKTIDKFIKMLSDMNKRQNKTVTPYYSFKDTLTDYLNVIFSEQWRGELKQQIEKVGS